MSKGPQMMKLSGYSLLWGRRPPMALHRQRHLTALRTAGLTVTAAQREGQAHQAAAGRVVSSLDPAQLLWQRGGSGSPDWPTSGTASRQS